MRDDALRELIADAIVSGDQHQQQDHHRARGHQRFAEPEVAAHESALRKCRSARVARRNARRKPGSAHESRSSLNGRALCSVSSRAASHEIQPRRYEYAEPAVLAALRERAADRSARRPLTASASSGLHAIRAAPKTRVAHALRFHHLSRGC